MTVEEMLRQLRRRSRWLAARLQRNDPPMDQYVLVEGHIETALDELERAARVLEGTAQ